MQEILNNVHSARLLKGVTALVFIGIVFVFAKTWNEFRAGMYIGRDVAAQSTINVSADSEVFGKPDIANFSFSVVEEGKTVADAQKLATQKTNQAISVLEKSGVDKDKDIKTLGYNINPKYEYYVQPMYSSMPCSSSYCPPQPVKNPKVIGYEVSQTIEVKIRKLENAGDILTSIGGAGVSNVSGLTFKIEKEDDLKAQARAEAIKKAQEKAEVLADDLGVSLVRVVSFNENSYVPYMYGRGGAEMSVMSKGMDAAIAPEIPTGENSIRSNVNITYEIR